MDPDKILTEIKQINSRLDNLERKIDFLIVALRPLASIERAIRVIDSTIQRIVSRR